MVLKQRQYKILEHGNHLDNSFQAHSLGRNGNDTMWWRIPMLAINIDLIIHRYASDHNYIIGHVTTKKGYVDKNSHLHKGSTILNDTSDFPNMKYLT
jgi:hypothetical protein